MNKRDILKTEIYDALRDITVTESSGELLMDRIKEYTENTIDDIDIIRAMIDGINTEFKKRKLQNGS